MNGQGSNQVRSEENHRQKGPGKEDGREEDDREEDDREEDCREEDCRQEARGQKDRREEDHRQEVDRQEKISPAEAARASRQLDRRGARAPLRAGAPFGSKVAKVEPFTRARARTHARVRETVGCVGFSRARSVRAAATAKDALERVPVVLTHSAST